MLLDVFNFHMCFVYKELTGRIFFEFYIIFSNESDFINCTIHYCFKDGLFREFRHSSPSPQKDRSDLVDRLSSVELQD